MVESLHFIEAGARAGEKKPGACKKRTGLGQRHGLGRFCRAEHFLNMFCTTWLFLLLFTTFYIVLTAPGKFSSHQVKVYILD